RLRAHGDRDAQVADQWRDNVSGPVAVLAAVAGAPAEPNRGGVNGFLPEGAKALALKRHLAVPHLTAVEERLEPVVGRPRQDHAAQPLPALVLCQRSTKGFAAQKTVAGV